MRVYDIALIQDHGCSYALREELHKKILELKQTMPGFRLHGASIYNGARHNDHVFLDGMIAYSYIRKTDEELKSKPRVKVMNFNNFSSQEALTSEVQNFIQACEKESRLKVFEVIGFSVTNTRTKRWNGKKYDKIYFWHGCLTYKILEEKHE